MIKRNEGKFEKMETRTGQGAQMVGREYDGRFQSQDNKRPREENEQHANDPKRKNVQKNGPPTHGTNPPIATQ